MKRATAFSSEGGFNPSHFVNSYLQKHTWLIVSLILAIGILLRLPHLNRSLWYDELWSTSIKLKNLVSLGVTALLDPHPPFYVVFMYLWITIFGDSEISVRIPPLIFGTLSIVLVYFLALKFLRKNPSLLAAFLMCISPVHIWYSREARPYSATLFLLLASILSYYKLSDSRANSQVWYLIYFTSLCFAVFSHYYIVIFLVLISIIARSQPNVLRNRLLIANALILVLFTLYIGVKLIVGRFLTGSSYLRPFTVQELFALFFNWFLTGNSLWNNIDTYIFDLYVFPQITAKYCIQIIFLFIFVKGIISIIKSKGQPPQIHLILYQFSLPFFLFILTLIGFKNIYIERSLLVVLPFYFLILVKGLTDFKNGSIMAVVIIAVLLFKVVTLSLFFYKNDEWTVYKPNPDWRAASYYFREELKSNSEPTFIFATSKSTELIYYDYRFREFRESEIQNFAKRKIDKLEQLFGEESYLSKVLSSEINKYITSIMKETYEARIIIHYVAKKKDIDEILTDKNKEVLYLVHNKYWSSGFNNLVKDITEDFRFNLLGKQSFQGLEIFKFNVAAAAPQSHVTRRGSICHSQSNWQGL